MQILAVNNRKNSFIFWKLLRKEIERNEQVKRRKEILMERDKERERESIVKRASVEVRGREKKWWGTGEKNSIF